jgi:photosystem II stability/assembly factor-like uncharacterized protein
MKKLVITLLLGLSQLAAQVPFIKTNIIGGGRYEDISFINKDTGYAASSQGYVMKTVNGGQSWSTVILGYTYYRSVDFTTSKKGFVGGLSNSSQDILKMTKDGGSTWTDLSNKLPNTVTRICGIDCIDTSVICAVGAWSSPAYFVKTTDGGVTWVTKDMSGYASGLVDVNFLNRNVGFVSGRSIIPSEGGIILKTTDGGITWTKVYTTNINSEFCWKMQSIDSTFMVASIQKSSSTPENRIAKSTDGGNNWITKTVSFYQGYNQMIGFISKQKGWTGYWKLFETNDGGETWEVKATSGAIFNRFHRIDSVNAYLSGDYIYKFDPSFIGIQENSSMDSVLSVKITPNPVERNQQIKLKVQTEKSTPINLIIFDSMGNQIYSDLTGFLNEGENKLELPPLKSAGIYQIYIMVNKGIYNGRIVIK